MSFRFTKARSLVSLSSTSLYLYQLAKAFNPMLLHSTYIAYTSTTIDPKYRHF
jgi:hypothetical protein